MLKALELIGFKSFADKTRFEFPPGITVVVGPNGSGKSNIVDAIKWVLGEQSAKSLRGKDMADVIFKGAGGTGRKPMNTAEATIVIDNAEGRLPVDAPEVHVTRRVYRGGEGEYLINREPCRLKDIRDLFRGTGVGTDAYSLIEQGKVDRLLQASPKDRRAIFEEAAGISRFKAKKIEAQRRLARVEQNLVRLRDIVDEVDDRLRSVRSQAVKARRYREYTERLQQLRTQVGQSDWRRLTEKLEALEGELTVLRDRVDELTARVEGDEARALELDALLTDCVERAGRSESRLARLGEQIAARLATLSQERRRRRDADQEASRFRVQLSAMTGRAGDIRQRLDDALESLRTARDTHQQVQDRVELRQQSLDSALSRIEGLRDETDRQRVRHAARMREATSLADRVGTLRATSENLADSAQRCREGLEELRPVLSEQLERREALGQEWKTRQAELEETETQLDALLRELKQDRRLVERRQDELVEIQGQLSGCSRRADVLEELERNREGLSEGVKCLLQRAGEAREGALTDVRGIVADLIRSDVAYARAVDVALGESAQRVVVRSNRLAEELRSGQFVPERRVGFVRADTPAARRDGDRVRLDGMVGVIGRADRLVSHDPEFAALVHKLLGDVWLVESLNDAFRLQLLGGRGARLVTVGGELLESDGSLTVGPPLEAGGLVSRKSELVALRREIDHLRRRASQSAEEIGRLRENIERKESAAERLGANHQESRAQLADVRARMETLSQRIETAEARRTAFESELLAAEQRRRVVRDELAEAQAELAGAEDEVRELETRLRENQTSSQEAERERHRRLAELTEAKVELAKSEQQVESWQARMVQFEEDRRERNRTIQEATRQLNAAVDRSRGSELELLRVSAELAELYLAKEQVAREIGRFRRERDENLRMRDELSKQSQVLRQKIRKEEERRHRKELEAGEARHDRAAMAGRLRDDYGIEISQLEQPLSEEALQERELVEEEIQSLRRKIGNIGAVNMEALNELDDLETRHGSLHSQYQDLNDAKQSLERIIHKINADSRRLFVETLEAIRANFQVLYRKSFGGGKADIVLDDEQDVLEAGIEIIATPPGKPSFNNSLLSGGEKALTAVALLLAIFQYRPSPFCVLDEVDAPFDEANIGRFIDVLKEFLGWTKFVIVTHSKKTMSSATTLYGVTMQESGVSKQVSVRFDDVTDDGHIRQEAIDRDDRTDDDEQAA